MKLTWVLLLVGLGLCVVAAPAAAQGYFGISAGLYEPEDKGQEQTQVYDVRGGYLINSRLGFEWSLSQLHLSDIVPFEDNPTIPGIDFDTLNLKLDIYNLDLSAQWFARGGGFVVFGGPGVAQLDADLVVTFFGETFIEPDRTNIFTAHAGVGYVWEINNHFFVRSEARVRHYFGDEVTEPDRIQGFFYSYKQTDYQAGLTVGWKYGS